VRHWNDFANSELPKLRIISKPPFSEQDGQHALSEMLAILALMGVVFLDDPSSDDLFDNGSIDIC